MFIDAELDCSNQPQECFLYNFMLFIMFDLMGYFVNALGAYMTSLPKVDHCYCSKIFNFQTI